MITGAALGIIEGYYGHWGKSGEGWQNITGERDLGTTGRVWGNAGELERYGKWTEILGVTREKVNGGWGLWG